ncbi:MAG: DGQHR domain-containing protein [Polyangiaceae bacterium]|nr:DGQHR domain-containing protein [Polyangiaceae bacterium]
MLTLPALKVQQYAQSFYLLNLAAADVERLVRFEVLGQASVRGAGPAKQKGKASAVNWGAIEHRVETSEKAYQRPILRRKIDELANYYLQCREDGAMPAIPGAVLLTTDEPVEFAPQAGNPFVGLVQLSQEEGTLRVLDGQHRLLALAALLASPQLGEADRAAAKMLQVPAILFAGLPAPAVVEMFVTINSKHTRLNPSLLFSLKGKQIYVRDLDVLIHDTIRKLNESESSPLRGLVKMLGVGAGKVSQAGLAQELERALESIATSHGDAPWHADFRAHASRFYLAYFKEIARVFEAAWGSKKHSVQSLIALRAFLQASVLIAPRVMSAGGDPRTSLRVLLAPWTSRIGSDRFETAGAWRAKAAGGGKESTRLLSRELGASLGAFEGPATSGGGT